MIQIKSVLIGDEIESQCVDVLKASGVNTTKKTKLSEADLIAELKNHDSVIVRSATKITRAVIAGAAASLKLIGRAGTGVDNIDVKAATEYGVIVMNTPAGNSRSAAELTCALIMALARHVPQAAASMRQGKWARKDYMGEEIYGKTLAIIGLGRIGQEVASRMQAFGMKTIGFDPLVSKEEAQRFGVEWHSLEEIWPLADYITVHVPLIDATRDLLSAATFTRCRRGVRVVNVARGGIINEQDLVDALNSGHVGGAALDVFCEEPPLALGELVGHSRVICTPHLGASTAQAQERVAVEIAENIVSLNAGRGVFGALNASALAAVLDETKAQYAKAASNLGRVLAALAPNAKTVVVKYPSGAAGLQKALTASAVVGLLTANGGSSGAPIGGLNLINAEMNAAKQGITVKTELTVGTNELTLATCGEGDNQAFATVTGYPSPAGTILSAVNGSRVPVPVLAAGCLVIAKKTAENGGGAFASDAKLSPKLSVEYGLIGGGRLALFDDSLTADEMQRLTSANYHVVQFGNNNNSPNNNNGGTLNNNSNS